MRAYKNYDKINAHNIVNYISDNQAISIRTKNMSEYRKVLFYGKVSELLKWENKTVMDKLAYKKLLSITIKGSTLIIEID